MYSLREGTQKIARVGNVFAYVTAVYPRYRALSLRRRISSKLLVFAP